MMHPTELTISDALRDPVIRQVLRADGISLPDFAVVLHKAARRQQENIVRFDGRFAAPLVTGAAGLMKSADDGANVTDIGN